MLLYGSELTGDICRPRWIETTRTAGTDHKRAAASILWSTGPNIPHWEDPIQTRLQLQVQHSPYEGFSPGHPRLHGLRSLDFVSRDLQE